MLCLHCGHLNDPETNFCSKCSSVLPERTAPPAIMDNFDKLVDAVTKLKAREINPSEFRDVLSRMEISFAGILKEIQEMDMPDGLAEEIRDEMAAGKGGIQLYLEAMNEMKMYFDKRDPLCLDRGLVMAKDANGRINRALKLNFEAYHNLQETAEEFLRTQSMI